MRARDGGVVMGGGDSSEMGSVMEERKLTTGVGAKFTLQIRDKEETSTYGFEHFQQGFPYYRTQPAFVKSDSHEYSSCMQSAAPVLRDPINI